MSDDRELAPEPGAGGPEADDDAAEARAAATLADTSSAIVSGVARSAPGYLVGAAGRVLDAWGRFEPEARAALDARLDDAARVATDRVVGELESLFGADPALQRRTPLQVVRGLVREPAAVLRGAGVPPVVRDEFEERSFPDDEYGLAPRTLGDLGEPDLAPLHLAWGVAKSTVLRARPAPRDDRAP